MSPSYKFAAWWGGQEGSLLLWSWLLAIYSAVAVFTNRRKLREAIPYVAGDPSRDPGTAVIAPFSASMRNGLATNTFRVRKNI